MIDGYYNNTMGAFDYPIRCTRPKPVGHGYMFSMAVDTIGEWLKLVPFFGRGRTVYSEGGMGLAVFLINILTVKHLKINILAWVPRKINK